MKVLRRAREHRALGARARSTAAAACESTARVSFVRLRNLTGITIPSCPCRRPSASRSASRRRATQRREPARPPPARAAGSPADAAGRKPRPRRPTPSVTWLTRARTVDALHRRRRAAGVEGEAAGPGGARATGCRRRGIDARMAFAVRSFVSAARRARDGAIAIDPSSRGRRRDGHGGGASRRPSATLGGRSTRFIDSAAPWGSDKAAAVVDPSCNRAWQRWTTHESHSPQQPLAVRRTHVRCARELVAGGSGARAAAAAARPARRHRA